MYFKILGGFWPNFTEPPRFLSHSCFKRLSNFLVIQGEKHHHRNFCDQSRCSILWLPLGLNIEFSRGKQLRPDCVDCYNLSIVDQDGQRRWLSRVVWFWRSWDIIALSWYISASISFLQAQRCSFFQETYTCHTPKLIKLCYVLMGLILGLQLQIILPASEWYWPKRKVYKGVIVPKASPGKVLQ